MKKIKRKRSLCVFCGSKNGNSTIYIDAAKELGLRLAKNKIKLVYGGGSLGLMGELSKSVQQNNGEVLGIIPKHLLKIEGINKTRGEVVITEDMHVRKKTMYDNSDAFLCLPGGIGTLEEVSETITWFQLNISRKPIFFLNVNGYWNNFRVLMEQFVSLEFANKNLLNYFMFFETVEALIPSLLNSLEIDSKE
ncbi:TIGR00730 family Rossman fold protein [Paracoccaceae bacterium]|nr:TIGR00730 family Rossman fold protein [Paracoccaceae bacterium]